MPNQPANVEVAVLNAAVLFRVTGRATAAVSGAFKTASDQLRLQGHRRFLLDLTLCQSMDSTFIGVLTGLSRRLRSPSDERARGSVELVNLTPTVREQIDNLFVLDQFVVRDCRTEAPAGFETVQKEPDNKLDLCRLMLEAHQTLMDANPANVPKFKQVAQFLHDDLNRMTG